MEEAPLSSSPPSPHPPKESLPRRYNKVVWRVLLISNLAIGGSRSSYHGRQMSVQLNTFRRRRIFFKDRLPAQFAYMFVRARKKDTAAEKNKAAAKITSTPVATTATSVPEEPLLSPPITEPVKVCEPIPEDQQCELFKWILEEKRRVKPNDREGKKRIDEDKALLKQFIRSKSIPSL